GVEARDPDLHGVGAQPGEVGDLLRERVQTVLVHRSRHPVDDGVAPPGHHAPGPPVHQRGGGDLPEPRGGSVRLGFLVGPRRRGHVVIVTQDVVEHTTSRRLAACPGTQTSSTARCGRTRRHAPSTTPTRTRTTTATGGGRSRPRAPAGPRSSGTGRACCTP